MNLWSQVKELISTKSHRIGFLVGTPDRYTNEIVSEATTLSLPAYFAAIKIKADVIASLPIHVYRITNGEKQRVRDRLHTILHRRPNKWMTPSDLKRAIAYSLSMRGASYSLIGRAGGKVASLTPLCYDRMHFEFDEFEGPLYQYTSTKGATERLDPANVLHIRGFGPDGFQGVDPMMAGGRTISSSLATERYAGTYFANGGKFESVFETDRLLNETQRVQFQALIEKWTSGENQHKDLILEAGFKHKSASRDPEKSQLLESRKSNQNNLLKYLNVTPDMAGDLDRATFSNIEELGTRFVDYSLRPDIVAIEEHLNLALIPFEQQENMRVEFNLDALLRGNTLARAAFYSAMVQNGIWTRNEVRAKENMPPMPNADDLTIQLNLQGINENGPQSANAAV